MSLSLIKSIEPFPPYEGTEHLAYSADEAMRRLVYDRGNDEFIVSVLLTEIEWQWALDSWQFNYFFDGETGVFKRMEAIPNKYWVNVGYMYVNWANGSFGQVYGSTDGAGALFERIGFEVDIASWFPVTGGWSSSDFGTWVPEPTDLAIITYCTERSLLIGVNNQDAQVWDLSGTPSLISELRLPGTVTSIGYENKNYVWFVTQDGIILKMNYGLDPVRFEMMSSVEENEPDVVAYRTCYDSRRKRVVILKCKEDVGQQNPSVFEFYRPYYVASQITDPVPINRIAGTEVTNFIGHLLGSIGEGVASKIVTSSLAEPVQGTLLTNLAPTTQNGSFIVKYQCPNFGYTGTLQLSADTSVIWD